MSMAYRNFQFRFFSTLKGSPCCPEDGPRFSKEKEGADGVVVKTRGWNSDGFRGTKMPLVIDTEMAASLRSLTPDALGKLLGSKLKPAEVAATQTRLTAMLAHVDQLEANGMVINPSRWGTEEINKIVLDDKQSSYVGRDFTSALKNAQYSTDRS
jgi:hypothetical protein